MFIAYLIYAMILHTAFSPCTCVLAFDAAEVTGCDNDFFAY
jgi:hypothetical protein